jgi:hypothetical protein
MACSADVIGEGFRLADHGATDDCNCISADYTQPNFTRESYDTQQVIELTVYNQLALTH